MQCPVDQAQLVMSERQGVEIDYCPVCRGIWLDRGELDKILDRAATTPVGGVDPRAVPGAAAPDPRPVYGSPDPRPVYPAPDPRATGYDPRYDDRRRDPRDPRYGYDGRKRKKKDSWLEDIFDF
ncbi:zf-TFIIB domain-containing protein [Cellulomonas oligotrophica]|uniref:Transcription factor zinc-finger domain-containing protein n=1 Tax=Cellulomonas oligotrophica TaxID=931536 RepID=A0A7Y9FG48_9CELL|nr:zf-TFIIB domain-containing protein [Cellulomonas oligotrophica]NYD86723.1 hypothetical protein [Cellulomonas oligotrophica]GIG34562.1 hypothetical protein Col01nite_37210 [Cellulomonas oligotrophica]